jgi:hypothetical protein
MNMHHDTQVISVKGKQIAVPAIRVSDVVLVVTGKILKIARIHDEAWLDSRSLPSPLEIVGKLQSSKNSPDIFTFTQRLPDVAPRYPYPFELENVAAATIGSYRSWFENDIDRSVRKHIRKGQREGIVTRIVPFDDRLVEGICSIYNESKVRQGKPFWHYGKSFDEVKRENGTYLDRSVFICTYLGEELVGFIKVVIDGEVATMMQILSKLAHFSRRPTNALISKTVEVCESRHAKYLLYGEYTYGKKDESTLIDFKAKNGFKKIEFPRYYVPLTAKGHFAVKFGLHKGWANLLPGPITKTLVHLRSKYHSWRTDNSKGPKESEQAEK